MLKQKIIDILEANFALMSEPKVDLILSEVEKVFEECLPDEKRWRIHDNYTAKDYRLIDFGMGHNSCREQTKTNFKKLL